MPTAVMECWQALPNVQRASIYPGEGHTVQYRHWDQILVDTAGHTDQTVVCRTDLVGNEQVDGLVDHGATLGLCAWSP